jgi:hypothetical protein
MSKKPKPKTITVEEATCNKCGNPGHEPAECQEKRFKKLWPGQFVFHGKIRTPDGDVVELQMPVGLVGV